MADFEKSPTPRYQASHSSPSLTTPLKNPIHICSSSDYEGNEENIIPKPTKNGISADKENRTPFFISETNQKHQLIYSSTSKLMKQPSPFRQLLNFHEFSPGLECGKWVSLNSEKDAWDHSDDSEAAPASAWSTVPNWSLLCRPLAVDVGKCRCVIVKEKGMDGIEGSLYSLYTVEGKGRKDRKLAIAHHIRCNGRSVFIVARNVKGIRKNCSDESLIGIVTSNFMGSKYCIWDDQGTSFHPLKKHSKLLIALVRFIPTIATWTGSYRSMSAWIPMYQSIQFRNTTQAPHIKGLPRDWEAKKDNVHQLFSRAPNYDRISKHYELDYRDGESVGLPIQRSVKNFQLTLGESGKQTILKLGRLGKSKYAMDYRHPLTGYQAFCICLASMDSKLCCTV